MDLIFRAFQISPNFFLFLDDICIFWIYCRTLGTKIATGDPRVSKLLDFQEFSDFQKSDFCWMSRFPDFCILQNFCILSGLMAVSTEPKELPELRGCRNDRNLGLFSYLHVSRGLSARKARRTKSRPKGTQLEAGARREGPRLLVCIILSHCDCTQRRPQCVHT